MIRWPITLLALSAPALAQQATNPTPVALVCAYNSAIPSPVDGQFFYVQCDSSGRVITTGGGGGGGSPGGSSGQLQYNSGGSFGGISGWTTNGSTALTGGASSTLTVGGASQVHTFDLNGTAEFTGATLGTTLGGGTGFVGIGNVPQSGYGLVVKPSGNFNLLAGEIIVIGANAHIVPTGTVAAATASFGAVINTTWGGSVDNSAAALVYGSQNEAFVTDTASVYRTFGTESASVITTTGTIVESNGEWVHIDNQGTGTLTTANGLLASISNIGGGTITNANGVRVSTLNGTNNVGLKIDDQTNGSTNYAIYTGLGAVRFGDALSAPNATIPILHGSIVMGEGGTGATASTLTVNGSTGQGANLFQLQANGSNVFAVSKTGGATINGDTFFMANAFWGSNQTIRITSQILQAASSIVGWSSTIHAYDPIDLALIRAGTGALLVSGNNGGTAVGVVIPKATTVSGLPSASIGVGARTTVTDATSCTLGGSLTGGGSTVCPVYSTGSTWVGG